MANPAIKIEALTLRRPQSEGVTATPVGSGGIVTTVPPQTEKKIFTGNTKIISSKQEQSPPTGVPLEVLEQYGLLGVNPSKNS